MGNLERLAWAGMRLSLEGPIQAASQVVGVESNLGKRAGWRDARFSSYAGGECLCLVGHHAELDRVV